ncbi:hypothetical protein V6N11_056810 [Hibiscus sabdariffa]|uniref:Uncharacterized protein n=1 Tax=Hibiscus sabdariffa TaxID=183260 RepID=A0ABR2T4X1_9ROSI
MKIAAQYVKLQKMGKEYVRNRHQMEWKPANACMNATTTTMEICRQKTNSAMWGSDHAVCSAMMPVVTKIAQLNTQGHKKGMALAWILLVYLLHINVFAILIVRTKTY